MTKRHSAKYKIDRRMGENIWGRPKSPINQRSYGPGQHGQRRKFKVSDFGLQLRAKQKLKGYYGNLTEKQFARTYDEAARRKGNTSENLIALLEARLDSVAYRMGFGASRTESRQVVRHNGVLVNGKRVNIPSYIVKPGDVVQLTDRARASLRCKAALEAAESRGFPEWIAVDVKEGKGTFKAMPQRSELPSTLNEGLVIELYSK